jgi:hypothetical protein
VETLDSTHGLDFVSRLNPVSFEYNDSNKPAFGFIAEEVNQLDSKLVFYEADSVTPRGVNYEQFAPILTKAIQELYIQTKNIAAIIADIGNYLADKVVSIKEATIGILRIGDKVCADDVCVTKEQFKQMLLNGGGSSATSTQDNSNTGGGGTSTENATSTDNITGSSTPNSNSNSILDNEGSDINASSTIVTTPDVVTPPPESSTEPSDVVPPETPSNEIAPTGNSDPI